MILFSSSVQPNSLDFIQPTPQFSSKMIARLRREIKPDELDEMLVDRTRHTNNDVPSNFCG